MQTELSKLVDTAMKSITQAWAQSSIWDLATSAGHAARLADRSAVMLCFITLTMLLLFCVTYAQVIWAQLALAILIFLGPIFIPWLVFDPLAFLFWGWFRALIVYALYGAIAGAIMRVFAGVGIGYITTLATEAAGTDVNSLEAMGKWTVTILPLCVAGLLASLKVGDLALDARQRKRIERRGADVRRHDGGHRRQGSGRGRRDEEVMPKKTRGKSTPRYGGEAVHSNRHLRVLSLVLGGVSLLLVIAIIRLASLEPPRPIVVRVDEVGRAEALAYDTVEAKANPLDPTTKYF